MLNSSDLFTPHGYRLRPFSLIDKEKPKIARETDKYTFTHFNEQDYPELALVVQQMQGESYLTSGYVTSDEIDEYGRLKAYLDGARGTNVEYVTAQTEDEVMASVRLITIPENGNLYDLPSFKKSAEAMYPGFEDMLYSLFLQNPDRGVVEISSLSRRKHATPSILLDVIREIVQQAVRAKSDELWLVTATDNSFDMIRSRFGDAAITSIGDRVPVYNDGKVTKELCLQPSIIVPGRLIGSIAESAKNEKNTLQQKRLMKSLFYMSDGLDANAGEIPEIAYELLESTKSRVI